MADQSRDDVNARWNAAIEAPIGDTDDRDLRMRAIDAALRFAGPTTDVATVLRAAAFFTKFALDGLAPPLFADLDENGAA